MPATVQSPGEQQPLGDTMGAMLLGILFSGVLYGMSLVQAYNYHDGAFSILHQKSALKPRQVIARMHGT